MPCRSRVFACSSTALKTGTAVSFFVLLPTFPAFGPFSANLAPDFPRFSTPPHPTCACLTMLAAQACSFRHDGRPHCRCQQCPFQSTPSMPVPMHAPLLVHRTGKTEIHPHPTTTRSQILLPCSLPLSALLQAVVIPAPTRRVRSKKCAPSSHPQLDKAIRATASPTRPVRPRAQAKRPASVLHQASADTSTFSPTAALHISSACRLDFSTTSLEILDRFMVL